jgi:hypothetical protein
MDLLMLSSDAPHEPGAGALRWPLLLPRQRPLTNDLSLNLAMKTQEPARLSARPELQAWDVLLKFFFAGGEAARDPPS